MMEAILGIILLGISLAAPIGPAGVAVIQSGFRHGFLRAFLTGLGVTTADATYILIVFFGLSSMMDHPVVKVLFLSGGAFVLLFLGYQSITASRREFSEGPASESKGRNPFLIGCMVNLSNPIAAVW
jgi:threonine/homoserine/homoserine lactone efflux protein